MDDFPRNTTPSLFPTASPLAQEVVFDPLNIEEEDLFARDIDGQLVRLSEATVEDYDTEVTIKIDGQDVTVKKAVPLKDSQGNIITDQDGVTAPRSTTIYDAAAQLFVKKPGDVNPIPTLCHREHMRPVGVCRVCMVELYRTTGGKRQGTGSLVAACHHRVEVGMEVQTIESPNDPAAGQRVRNAVKVLTELLVADHLNESELSKSQNTGSITNELAALARRMGITKSRFAPRRLDRGQDPSSLQIAVDHNSCILCDRCVRACSDVKKNFVIGRTGKGYTARIGFDLDNPMGESSCVSCGECMISCPTDALMYRRQVQPQEHYGPGSSPITAGELLKMPLFASVPYKFLQWNSSSVVRQRLKAGEVLCREGEYGHEAFLLTKGEFAVSSRAVAGREVKQAEGIAWKLFGKLRTKLVRREEEDSTRSPINPFTTGVPTSNKLTTDDVIIGEMACMNHYPRSATVTAVTDAEVLRIDRNVLDMLKRNEAARRILDGLYRKRALKSQLETVGVLRSLSDGERKECVAYLRDIVELARVDPGQIIFRQGEKADHFYIVHLGFVKVTQDHGGQRRVRNYLGPGSHFGEIGIISALGEELGEHFPAGLISRRTATCEALDHVELVRIRGEHFRDLWRRYPTFRASLIGYAEQLLKTDQESQAAAITPLSEFLHQGLFQAQSLLVLDLEACTRCDECTKACSDTHDGVTRLIREGLRFDKWLVASSCRSCLDPYCLVGCPVDAIHREGSTEIRIEDHCIGCGQCAKNCPYGNINMHGFVMDLADPDSAGRTRAVVQQRATTCDLCRDTVRPGQDPSCVYACPHDAAFRMTGSQLLQQVTKS